VPFSGWPFSGLRFPVLSEEAAAAEDDAAYEDRRHTMMAVPVELVPAVQKLIKRKVG